MEDAPLLDDAPGSDSWIWETRLHQHATLPASSMGANCISSMAQFHYNHHLGRSPARAISRILPCMQPAPRADSRRTGWRVIQPPASPC